MTYCYHCGRMTAGEPLFCGTCGRTYDVKLCPRRHSNPRHAEVCSQCGSRDLSMPQPKVPFLWRAGMFLAKVLMGLLLVLIALNVASAILQRPETQNALVCLGILGALLWWLWSELPDWLQRFIRRRLRRKEQPRDR